MQAHKQRITVPASRELRIKLPDEAAAHEEAEVIVLFKRASQADEEKFAAMEQAMNDEMFLADLRDTMNDFADADRDAQAL